jgi:hypothetical protein
MAGDVEPDALEAVERATPPAVEVDDREAEQPEGD